MEILPDPTKDIVVDAVHSYFTQKPVGLAQPLTPAEEKGEDHTNGPLRRVRKWIRKAPPIREDTQVSSRTSRTSASSSNTHTRIEPDSPASPAGGIDGYSKRQGKNLLHGDDSCKLT